MSAARRRLLIEEMAFDLLEDLLLSLVQWHYAYDYRPTTALGPPTSQG